MSKGASGRHRHASGGGAEENGAMLNGEEEDEQERERGQEEGGGGATRPPRARLGRTNVVGWSNMSHELKKELKGHTNHGFPMALLEAKRHVHGGTVKIPVVTYGEDKDVKFFFGRPTDWPLGLAGKVLRREARVDVMTLSVADDFGIAPKSHPHHHHQHQHQHHHPATNRMGGGPKGDSSKDSAPFADDAGSGSGRPCFIGVATASLQGGCSYQEDRFVSFKELSEVPNVKVPPGISFFGVYDGHGGHKVAEYLMEHLHLNFGAELRRPRASISSALRASFKRTDKELLEMWCSMSPEERRESGHAEDYCSGAAAVVVVMHERNVVIAHVGDCRVALCTKGECVDLTVDHTYANCSERTRVSDLGGMWEAERLDGTLAVSRAFGDFEARKGDEDGKPLGLVSDPEMREMSLGPDVEFLLVR